MSDIIEKSRNRWAGRVVESIPAAILEVLKEKPRTSGELAKIGGKDRTAIFRYLQALQKEEKVEKDGDYWKVKGAKQEAAQIRLEELSKETLWQLPVMQEVYRALKATKNARQRLTAVEAIVLGRTLPTFKINPQNWSHPQTTISFVEAYRQHHNIPLGDDLPHNVRMAIRDLIQAGLNHHISKVEGLKLGIHGKKDSIGENADVKMSDDQIEALANYYLQKNNEEMAAYVYFAIETFARPNSVFRAEVGNFQLERMKLKKLTVAGFEPLYDEQQILMLSLVAQGNANVKLDIQQLEVEYFTGKIYEEKTETMWPKQIRDKAAVALLKDWQKRRSEGGYKRWFGEKEETESQFGKRIIPQLKEGYKAIGLTHPYFYQDSRYALRHCGAHVWLRRTEYDYGAVARMGWEDITTLMIWYGKYDTTSLDAMLRKEF